MYLLESTTTHQIQTNIQTFKADQSLSVLLAQPTSLPSTMQLPQTVTPWLPACPRPEPWSGPRTARSAPPASHCPSSVAPPANPEERSESLLSGPRRSARDLASAILGGCARGRPAPCTCLSFCSSARLFSAPTLVLTFFITLTLVCRSSVTPLVKLRWSTRSSLSACSAVTEQGGGEGGVVGGGFKKSLLGPLPSLFVKYLESYVMYVCCQTQKLFLIHWGSITCVFFPFLSPAESRKITHLPNSDVAC